MKRKHTSVTKKEKFTDTAAKFEAVLADLDNGVIEILVKHSTFYMVYVIIHTVVCIIIELVVPWK